MNSKGGVVSIESPTACNFCMLGALMRAGYQLAIMGTPVLMCISHVNPDAWDIVGFNDTHTHAEVIATLDAATKFAEVSGG